MKPFRNLLLIGISFILLFASCKKDKQPPASELSKLPPATQSGANTFGCLVDGKAFVPNNRSLLQGPNLQCNYIYLNKGEYFLVSGSYKNKNGTYNTINIYTDSLSITEGQSVALTNYNEKGKAFGLYALFATPNNDRYYTNQIITGELHISKLDQPKYIVSGTFWFDAVDSKGNKVQIRDGRFDMVYTN